ncbi:HAD family hydrolase [Pandoraea iniqua]|uniref:HAD family hydrolase n=1 Tax=Pandoraea iniqua TaxID=2508288 RepID=UPI0012522B34|nr:HAD family hydrolase [Pandoraea iniqua]VVE07749.1 HAD family hydrolase [Pandoraea iniqua]
MTTIFRHRFILRRILSMTLAAACGVTAVGGCANSPGAATPPEATATTRAEVHSVAPLTPVDPVAASLPSWRDGPSRDTILKFVSDVTRVGAPTFLPVESRVAVFDNDGTLWSEQPIPFQLIFMIDQVKAAAPDHPEWKKRPAFKALMTNDVAALAANKKDAFALIAEANSGMSTEVYEASIRDWLARAKHPRFGRAYTDLIYQPQRELLALLRANGFQIWIVSGGTAEFMRVWASDAYGIPSERIVGSQEKLQYQARDGKPALIRKPGFDVFDDGPVKPVSIFRAIGRRPVLAIGNSDGDREMIEYTTGGDGPSLGVLIHHDDSVREFAYDRASHTAKLDKAWDQATRAGWVVVSMKKDWTTIFPFETTPAPNK